MKIMKIKGLLIISIALLFPMKVLPALGERSFLTKSPRATVMNEVQSAEVMMPMERHANSWTISDKSEPIESVPNSEWIYGGGEAEQNQQESKASPGLESVLSQQEACELALAYVELAQTYADMFRYEEGIPWADEAIRLDPNLTSAYLISGYLNFKMRYTEEAIAAFEKAIELNPAAFEAYLHLGIIYSGGRDLSLGIEYLNKALEVAKAPEDISTALAHRGLAYAIMLRYEDAFTDLDHALLIDPDNGMAVFIRGVVSEEMSKRANSASHPQGEPGGGMGKGLGS
jgi:tetratricopeptide (TPR) repeat protein